MYEKWLESIALNRELKWTDLRVLILLLANVKEGKTAEITQAEIAQKLGIETSNICRAIKKLNENKIINKKLIGGKLVGYKFLLEEE